MKYEETRQYEMLAQALVNNLAEKHLLKPITVVVTGKLTRKFGLAVYRQREIHLNPHLLGTSELDDTVRHEFAHFLAKDRYGEGGHGKKWQYCARLVGARPTTYVDVSLAAAQEVIKASSKYQYGCELGCTYPAYRRWRRTSLCTKHRLPLSMLREP